MGTGTVTTGHAVHGFVYGGPTYTTAYAIRGELQSTVSATNAYGVHGYCPAGTTRYGVYGEATNAGTFTKLYGVYGKAPIIQTNPTDWTSVTSWAGYFAGHVQVTGSFTSSDRKLKKDIKPLTGALSLIDKLAPKTYFYDAAKYPSMNLPTEPQFGLVAQDVQEVLPQLVLRAIHPEVVDSAGRITEPSIDYLTLNYQALIPILLSGIQEQQDKIGGLVESVAAKQAQVDKLTVRLEAIEKQLGLTSKGEQKLQGKAQLEQNAPNPFHESTTIRFHVPEGASSASIQVTGSDGKVVSSFGDLRPGQGQVIIAASSLGAGAYTYTLLVDGAKADSKTMVITR